MKPACIVFVICVYHVHHSDSICCGTDTHVINILRIGCTLVGCRGRLIKNVEVTNILFCHPTYHQLYYIYCEHFGVLDTHSQIRYSPMCLSNMICDGNYLCFVVHLKIILYVIRHLNKCWKLGH